MTYYEYTSAEHGRTDGYEGSVIGCYEVAPDMSFVRSLETYEDGVAYSFDLNHAADSYGILPDADMDVVAAREFGELNEISEAQFEQRWKETPVVNRENE